MKRDELVSMLERQVLNGYCLHEAVNELDILTHEFVESCSDDNINESDKTFNDYVSFISVRLSPQYREMFRLEMR